MCFADYWDVEPGGVYHVDNRRARKEHRCGECRRRISVGEDYWYHHGVYDGSGFSVKACQRCERVRTALERAVNHGSGQWREVVPLGELKCCIREWNREKRIKVYDRV